MCTLVHDWCTRMGRGIFTKFFLVVDYWFMSLTVKFHKEPNFHWGDIPLFVTLYKCNVEVKILSFFHPQLYPKVKKIPA